MSSKGWSRAAAVAACNYQHMKMMELGDEETGEVVLDNEITEVVKSDVIIKQEDKLVTKAMDYLAKPVDECIKACMAATGETEEEATKRCNSPAAKKARMVMKAFTDNDLDALMKAVIEDEEVKIVETEEMT